MAATNSKDLETLAKLGELRKAGIITEKGVAKPPFEESIKKLFEAN